MSFTFAKGKEECRREMKLIKLKDVRHRGKEELEGWDVINTKINYFLFFFSFYLFILLLFYFTILYWFCHTSTCIHQGCIRVFPILNPPPTSLPIISKKSVHLKFTKKSRIEEMEKSGHRTWREKSESVTKLMKAKEFCLITVKPVTVFKW